MRQTVFQAAVAGLVVALTSPSTLAQTAPAARLELQCSQRTPVTLRLAIRNDGSEPTAVIIGEILANDRQYVLGGLDFVLHRDGAADATVAYVDPTFSGRIGGRADDWLVMLPPGSAYSVALPMNEALRRNFSATARVSARLVAQPHAEHASSDLAGQRLIHVWTGTLVSESVSLPDSCLDRRE